MLFESLEGEVSEKHTPPSSGCLQTTDRRWSNMCVGVEGSWPGDPEGQVASAIQQGRTRWQGIQRIFVAVLLTLYVCHSS